jgi:hypothetical protein
MQCGSSQSLGKKQRVRTDKHRTISRGDLARGQTCDGIKDPRVLFLCPKVTGWMAPNRRFALMPLNSCSDKTFYQDFKAEN